MSQDKVDYVLGEVIMPVLLFIAIIAACFIWK